jgi:hypothetical protein
MIAKQHSEPVIAHHPTTVVEIRRTRAALAAQDRALMEEGAADYKAEKAGSPPSRPLNDHERLVNAHIHLLMNGSTPPHLLVPPVSRDAQRRAQRDAIAYVDRQLGRQEEDALEREAQQWAIDHDAQWRALCREIVLAAVKLAALEERARDTLKPIDGCWVRGLAMGSTIGSGLSLLGIGDPLLDLRTDALAEGIITASDIKKAEKNDF